MVITSSDVSGCNIAVEVMNLSSILNMRISSKIGDRFSFAT